MSLGRVIVRKLMLAFGIAAVSTAAAFSQPGSTDGPKSQEVSESDGIPVLVKHLPEWENVHEKAVFATDSQTLVSALGERPELGGLDFPPGTEAVTAQYDAGKLLLIEYASPQASIEADEKLKENISAAGGSTVYRRIGNYNALVFDATDAAAANSLLDQIKYEKEIQWLGDNPFRISAERAFVLTIGDIFFSTLFVILIGVGIALAGGFIAGVIFFKFSERRRARLATFSDAGGMTRLNLDGFTPEIQPQRFLGE